MKSRYALALAACATLWSFGPAAAQNKPTPSPLVNELERCRSIQDAAQRLACFDAASRSLVQATTSGQVTVVDQRQMQQARRSLFGFSMPKLPFLGGDDKAMDKLEATVKSVEALDSGRLRIVLAQDNAVWELTEVPISFVEPRPGQKVTILRGPLGSYFIRVNGQVGVRGRRIS